MYKNQLQVYAQRSCVDFPSYSCIREGPDHAPRFKSRVTFNGQVFESPRFCHTLRQAEHAAAEVALRMLSARRGARILDETGLYKNLLQETAHRAGFRLPVYTTVGFAPGFISTVDLAGMRFYGEAAKTKKQAQKSAAMAAWFALKQAARELCVSSSFSGVVGKDEEEQEIVARYLSHIKTSCSESSDFISLSHFGSSFGFQPRVSSGRSRVGEMVVPEVQFQSVVPENSSLIRDVPISGVSSEFCRLKL